MKCLGEFFLAAFPEGGAVVEVKGNERSVLLRRFRQRKAALRRLVAHGGNETGQVENVNALLPEDAVDVKILDGKCPADLARPVVPDAGRAQAEAGIGDVELVPVAPWAALLDL